MKRINVPAKDGALISAVTIDLDDSLKKAVVIICHGFGEHSGAYIEVGEELQKGGFASIIPDLRGHGTPPEGAKKWHGQVPNYQCFIDDIVSLTKTAKQIAPEKPIVLYGHSMGANIIINTLLKLPPEETTVYSCAILETPWLELYRPPGSLEMKLVKVLNIIAPRYRFMRKLNHEILSSDPERAGGYLIDPLYHGYISMRMGTGLIDGGKYAIENAPCFPIPAFLAYADTDRVISNKAIKEFAEKAGDIVTIKEYDSMHAIHNDKSRELFFNDVVAFIDSHIIST